MNKILDNTTTKIINPPSNDFQFFQPKLTINQPNDIYEQEADAVAEKMILMPAEETGKHFFKPKPVPVTALQRSCAACGQEEKLQRKEEDEEEPIQLKPGKEFDINRKCAHCEEEEKIQMKRNPTGNMNVPSVVYNTINSSGQPLDHGTKNFMESRFGYDFGNVQVHNDSLAHQSSAAINAMAYTNGNHIVFGAGQYQPTTNSGKQLLAHELTHVVQQNTNSIATKIQKAGITDEEDAIQRKAGPNGDVIQRQTIFPMPHMKAIAAIGYMANYMNNENILFDYWAGDCRDNNKNNKTDKDDSHERNQSDGTHFSGTYPGFKTTAGYFCDTSWGGWMIVPNDNDITATVKYRVCADLISQAYADAGIGITHKRSVGGIISFFKRSRHCQFWEIGSFPGPYIPGDLLFSYDGSHGHATMVLTYTPASDNPWVIHLPGQSQLLNMGVYDPTVLNDVRMEPWWPGRPKYGVGRYIG